MKPPPSPAIEIDTKLIPALSVADKSKRMTKRNTIRKMRQIRIIPAPARAFQFTMTEARRPEIRAMIEAIGPQETSSWTQTANRFPRIPDTKKKTAILMGDILGFSTRKPMMSKEMEQMQ